MRNVEIRAGAEIDVPLEEVRVGDVVRVRRSGVVLTARKLFDGTVFPWTP